MAKNRSPAAYIPFASRLVRQSMKSIQMKGGPRDEKATEGLLLPPSLRPSLPGRTCTTAKARSLERSFPPLPPIRTVFFASFYKTSQHRSNIEHASRLQSGTPSELMRTFRIWSGPTAQKNGGSRKWCTLETKNVPFPISMLPCVPTEIEFDMRLRRSTSAVMQQTAEVRRRAISN